MGATVGHDDESDRIWVAGYVVRDPSREASNWRSTGELEDRLKTLKDQGKLLEAQRHAIVRLRNQGTISNDVMHRIERELDLEDTRLEI